jgi:hypothetical protein
MSYEYDVFFSYKRRGPSLDWTRQVKDRFEFWLGEEFPDREPKVFVDEECIEAGDVWPEKLKHALSRSRCMVSLLSLPYFQSPWCLSEWRTFARRQQLTQRLDPGLIASIKFHDGKHFPEEARNIQWLDASPFAYTLAAFWNTPNAVGFEAKLKEFATSVAEMVKSAPDFSADWPIIEVEGLPIPPIPLAKL